MHPDASRRPRLGVVVDTLDIPSWVARALRSTRDAGVELLVVVVQKEATQPRLVPPASRWLQAYRILDRWRSPNGYRETAPTRIDAEISDGIVIQHVTNEDQLERALQRIDFALWMCPLEPEARLCRRLALLRWSVNGASFEEAEGQAITAVLNDQPMIELALEQLIPDAPNSTIRSSTTNVSRFSVSRTLEAVAREARLLLPRTLESWRVGRRGRLTLARSNAPRLTGLPALMDLTRRYLRQRAINLGRIQQWSLAFTRQAESTDVPVIVPGQYRDLLAPKGRDWADPFPFHQDGVDWVFFEELEYSRDIGHLVVAPLGPNGFDSPPRIIIQEDFHLSYPFVFRHKGEVYLAPETAENGRLLLYRATRFPYEWTQEGVLLDDVRCVDPTLAQIDGSWWLFAGSFEDPDHSWSELRLYHSDSPLGPWVPHSENPVLTDVRHGRPAGRLFQREGTWYRPAQDCSRGYEYGLAVCRIDELTPSAYRESVVEKLTPWSPDLCGVHTLNAAGNLTMIDLRRRKLWR